MEGVRGQLEVLSINLAWLSASRNLLQEVETEIAIEPCHFFLRTSFSVQLDRKPCQGHERRGRVELTLESDNQKMMPELLLKILRKRSSVTKLEMQRRQEKLSVFRCVIQRQSYLPHIQWDETLPPAGTRGWEPQPPVLMSGW